MPTTKKKATKRKSVTKKSYLTKRRLVSAARKGIRIAATKTMTTMGYTVIADKGSLVKKYPDGTIEKIKSLGKKKKTSRIHLD